MRDVRAVISKDKKMASARVFLVRAPSKKEKEASAFE
jgi:hypothetical protein